MRHHASIATTVATLALVAAGSAQATIAPQWITTYLDGDLFGPRALSVGEDGSSFILSTIEVANDEDIALTKFDAAGTFLWQSVYTGPIGQDLAVDVVVAADGAAVFAVGRSSVPGFGNSDYVIIKYDATTGAELWQRFYDGPASGIDDPRAAAATPDGGVVVTGGVWNDDERMDFGTVKLDADGNMAWEVTFGDNGPFLFNEDRGEVVAVTADGDVVVSGVARPATSGNDVVTFRYDGVTGAREWMARYSTSADERVEDVAIAPDGDIVVFGTDPFGFDRQWLAVRYDGATGIAQWTTLYDPGADESARSVAIDDAGDVYLAGATDPDGDDGNFNENIIVLALAGSTGAVRWIDERGDEGINDADFAYDLHPDGNGRLVVVGSSRSAFAVSGPFEQNAVILEYDTATGALIEQAIVDTTEPGGPIRTDAFLEIAASADGTRCLRGASSGDVGVATQLLLAKVAPPPREGDTNDDGVVDAIDYLAIIAQWGPCSGPCSADINLDGTVDALDLLAVIANWG